MNLRVSRAMVLLSDKLAEWRNMTKYDEMSNMTKCRNIKSKVVKFGEIGRSGEIGHFDEIVIKFKFNAMKLIENKSVVLSWVYLQPFCSTFFTFFTLFSILFRERQKHVSPRRVFFFFTCPKLFLRWHQMPVQGILGYPRAGCYCP